MSIGWVYWIHHNIWCCDNILSVRASCEDRCGITHSFEKHVQREHESDKLQVVLVCLVKKMVKKYIRLSIDLQWTINKCPIKNKFYTSIIRSIAFFA